MLVSIMHVSVMYMVPCMGDRYGTLDSLKVVCCTLAIVSMIDVMWVKLVVRTFDEPPWLASLPANKKHTPMYTHAPPSTGVSVHGEISVAKVTFSATKCHFHHKQTITTKHILF